MAKKDTQIVIDFANPIPTFSFGKDIVGRNVTIARSRLSRGWRVHIRTNGKGLSAEIEQAQRVKALAEAKAIQSEERIAAREQYLKDKAAGLVEEPDTRNLKDTEDPAQKRLDAPKGPVKQRDQVGLPRNENSTKPNEVKNDDGESEKSAGGTGDERGHGSTEGSESGTSGAVTADKF